MFLLLNVIQFVPFYLQYVFFFAPFCWPKKGILKHQALVSSAISLVETVAFRGGEIPLDWHE